ncbi:MAG: hypothetical protein A3K90_00440 [Pelodictyon luteolum]|uniref:DUF4412 domain-containing protein n=1 Tax=Pelodictyon luteolum TaxID=1100 RepID=A0A165M9L7_PELLU|nr:DUF4412 domain-containing protein [Pelodictyon luteolum]KZK74980.1 MAG: hypothetical protein A3K90_00440 [Pelodictyon luteolum]
MKQAVRLLVFSLFSIFLFSACKGQNPPDEGGLPYGSAQPFEGVMTMKTVIPGTGTTTTRIMVGQEGIRTESTANLAGLSGRVPVTVLSRTRDMGRIYLLNDVARTYMVFDAGANAATGSSAGESEPLRNAVVENLGEEMVNGYRCTHVRIAEKEGPGVVELWLNHDLLGYVAWTRMQATNRQTASMLAEKLRSAGLDGFPVRTLHRPSGVVTDLVKIERMKPDPALFSVPADYTKAEIPAVDPKMLSDESLDKLKGAAEKLQRQLQGR